MQVLDSMLHVTCKYDKEGSVPVQQHARGAFDAVVFDLLTALIDSWTLWNAVAGSPERGFAWRSKYLELTYQAGAYRGYEGMVREAAELAGIDPECAGELVRRWGELAPWPETHEVVATLARRVPLGIATNCSVTLGRIAAERSGGPYAVVATAESVGYLQAAAGALSVGPGKAADRARAHVVRRRLGSRRAGGQGGRYAGLLAQSHGTGASRPLPAGLHREVASPAAGSRCDAAPHRSRACPRRASKGSKRHASFSISIGSSAIASECWRVPGRLASRCARISRPPSRSTWRSCDRRSRSITVSTLKEAEYFARHGYARHCLRHRYRSGQARPCRAHSGDPGCDLILVTDSRWCGRRRALRPSENRVGFPFLVEIDCGEHRSGLLPTDAAVVEIARTIHASAPAEVPRRLDPCRPFLRHQGAREVSKIAAIERDAAVTAASQDSRRRAACDIVSVGSTPTVLHADHLRGVTEVRAGIYMLWDLAQFSRNMCSTTRSRSRCSPR